MSYPIMSWRHSLTVDEETAVNAAQPGSLIHKLSSLLDQREGTPNGRIPDRHELSLLDKQPYIPPNLIRLDE